MADDKNCQLVFVGESNPDDFGKRIEQKIAASKCADHIRITSWASVDTFTQYLAAANLGVQLRDQTRGETSATVLDCMNYGIPAIVNAHGSLAELPEDAVYKLPEAFTTNQLALALETLREDKTLRRDIGRKAAETIRRDHSPSACAKAYYSALESFYRHEATSIHAVCDAVAALPSAPEIESKEWKLLARCIARAFPPRLRHKQLLIDVSALAKIDLKTGSQRVVRSILLELLADPPAGYRVEPVYADFGLGYRYARALTARMLKVDLPLPDAPIDYAPGDCFLALDLASRIVSSHREFIRKLKEDGVKVKFVVYDLLLVLYPQYFPQGGFEEGAEWLEVVMESDGCVCISNAVAEDMREWIREHRTFENPGFTVDAFHLGADIENSMPSYGLPGDAESMLAKMKSRPSFLTVGTLEPRKGYRLTVDAFDRLWAQGVDVNLVIVGKRGWMMDAFFIRLENHPEKNHRLFWLECISDEYLEHVYGASSCLIAASEAEGFGLPLIEAAQKKIPILARDIPVFREVAGQHACYFSRNSPDILAVTIQDWLDAFGQGKHIRSDNMPWLTWKESANNLIRALKLENSKLGCWS